MGGPGGAGSNGMSHPRTVSAASTAMLGVDRTRGDAGEQPARPQAPPGHGRRPSAALDSLAVPSTTRSRHTSLLDDPIFERHARKARAFWDDKVKPKQRVLALHGLFEAVNPQDHPRVVSDVGSLAMPLIHAGYLYQVDKLRTKVKGVSQGSKEVVELFRIIHTLRYMLRALQQPVFNWQRDEIIRIVEDLLAPSNAVWLRVEGLNLIVDLLLLESKAVFAPAYTTEVNQILDCDLIRAANIQTPLLNAFADAIPLAPFRMFHDPANSGALRTFHDKPGWFARESQSTPHWQSNTDLHSPNIPQRDITGNRSSCKPVTAIDSLPVVASGPNASAINDSLELLQVFLDRFAEIATQAPLPNDTHIVRVSELAAGVSSKTDKTDYAFLSQDINAKGFPSVMIEGIEVPQIYTIKKSCMQARVLWALFSKYYLSFLFPALIRQLKICSVNDGVGFAQCPGPIITVLLRFISTKCVEERVDSNIRRLLLGDPVNSKIVHEILRQAVLLPFTYANTMRCALGAIKVWLLLPSEEALNIPECDSTSAMQAVRSRYDQYYIYLISLILRNVSPVDTTAGTKAVDEELVLYITSTSCNVYQQLVQLRELPDLVIESLILTMLQGVIFLSSSITSSSATFTSTPNILKMLSETLFYTCIKTGLTIERIWSKLQEVLSKLNHDSIVISQWSSTMLALTDAICPVVFKGVVVPTRTISPYRIRQLPGTSAAPDPEPTKSSVKVVLYGGDVKADHASMRFPTALQQLKMLKKDSQRDAQNISNSPMYDIHEVEKTIQVVDVLVEPDLQPFTNLQCVMKWEVLFSVTFWENFLAVLGDVSQIPSPNTFFEVLSCLAKCHEKLESFLELHIRSCSPTPDYYRRLSPTNFGPIYFKCAEVSDELSDGRSIAFGCMCRMMSRHSQYSTEPIPRSHYEEFYRIVYRGLLGTDSKVISSIICNSKRLFSSDLEYVIILIPAFISCISRSFLQSSTDQLSTISSTKIMGIRILGAISSLTSSFRAAECAGAPALGLRLKVHPSSVINFSSSITLGSSGHLARKLLTAILNLYIPVVSSQGVNRGSNAANYVAQTLWALSTAAYSELVVFGNIKNYDLAYEDDIKAMVPCMQLNDPLIVHAATTGLSLFADSPSMKKMSLDFIEYVVLEMSKCCKSQILVSEANFEIKTHNGVTVLQCIRDWVLAMPDALWEREELVDEILSLLDVCLSPEFSFDPQVSTNDKKQRGFKLGFRNFSSETSSLRKERDSAVIEADREPLSTNVSVKQTIGSVAENVFLQILSHARYLPPPYGWTAMSSTISDDLDYAMNELSDGDDTIEKKPYFGLKVVCRFFLLNNDKVLTLMYIPAASNGSEPKLMVIVRDRTGKFSWECKLRDTDVKRIGEMMMNDNKVSGNGGIANSTQPKSAIMTQNRINVVRRVLNQSNRRSVYRKANGTSVLEDKSKFVEFKNEPDYENFFKNADGSTDALDICLQYVGQTFEDCVTDGIAYKEQVGDDGKAHGHVLNAMTSMPYLFDAVENVSRTLEEYLELEAKMACVLNSDYYEVSRDEELVKELVELLRMKFETAKPLKVTSGESSRGLRAFAADLGFADMDIINANCVKLLVASPAFLRDLRELDKRLPRDVVKAAILYVAPGQTSEADILRNSAGSPEYDAFVQSLGWYVDLDTHTGYMGGLERNMTTGKTAPYYSNASVEVIFHDVTRIPTDADDERQMRKKRHVGNDYVHIVYSSNQSYAAHTIGGAFGNVSIVVTPKKDGMYVVDVEKDPQIPPFGLFNAPTTVSASVLGHVVRHTAICGYRAVMLSEMTAPLSRTEQPTAQSGTPTVTSNDNTAMERLGRLTRIPFTSKVLPIVDSAVFALPKGSLFVGFNKTLPMSPESPLRLHRARTFVKGTPSQASPSVATLTDNLGQDSRTASSTQPSVTSVGSPVLALSTASSPLGGRPQLAAVGSPITSSPRLTETGTSTESLPGTSRFVSHGGQMLLAGISRMQDNFSVRQSIIGVIAARHAHPSNTYEGVLRALFALN